MNVNIKLNVLLSAKSPFLSTSVTEKTPHTLTTEVFAHSSTIELELYVLYAVCSFGHLFTCAK